MKIDVTMGTIGRPALFRKAVHYLNNQKNANELYLWIMDGNKDDSVDKFLSSHRWNFLDVKLFKESECLAKKDKGLWPKIYNHLMKKGKAPLVTYWSDDVFPERDCFERGTRRFAEKLVGAVAFAWRDGEDKPYRVYGTEMHKQVMVNFGLFRRTVLEKVNFIDEDFRFYNADQDLSLKVWYAGFKVVKAGECKVTHSDGKKSKNEYRSGPHYKEDTRRFMVKWSYNKVAARKVKM